MNGAIRTSEQEEMAQLLRKNRMLVAFGSCAQLGGIPGLANLFAPGKHLEDGLFRIALAR